MSWFDTGFPYRANLTLDNTGIGALTNFPARIRLSGIQPRWAEGVRFAQGMDLLTHELDAVITIGGTTYADFHVLVPSIPNNDSMALQAYLGASHPVSVENGPAVWDANFMGVWHLAAQSGQYQDSTSRGHHATTTTVTRMNGRGDHPGYAGVFDGTDDQVVIPDHDDFSFTDGSNNDTPFTLEIAMIALAVTGYPLSKYASPASAEWRVYMSTNGRMYCFISDQGSVSNYVGRYTQANDVVVGEFRHWAITYDASETASGIDIYRDGVAKDVASTTGGAGYPTGMLNTSSDVTISSYSGAPLTNPFAGKMAEVRISDVQRSTDWIEATSACMHNTYVTSAGIESRIGGGAAKMLTNFAGFARTNPIYRANTQRLSELPTRIRRSPGIRRS